MTAFSSQGCSATSATSTSSRMATSVMRPRYGRMKAIVQRSSEGEPFASVIHPLVWVPPSAAAAAAPAPGSARCAE